MTFVEFLEAYARACDKASISSHDWINSYDPTLALSNKIENTVPLLLQLCTKKFSEQYIYPSESKFAKDKRFIRGLSSFRRLNTKNNI